MHVSQITDAVRGKRFADGLLVGRRDQLCEFEHFARLDGGRQVATDRSGRDLSLTRDLLHGLSRPVTLQRLTGSLVHARLCGWRT